MQRKNKNKEIKNSQEISLNIFWPSAIILTLAFIFAFVNLSNSILYSFPPNDFSDHLAQIKSTYEFWLNNNVTYWNNGNFIAGRIYGISWYATGAAINHLTNNPRISFIMIQLLLYATGFLGVYLYGRLKKYNIKKTILFYILFFLSPLSTAYFLGLGSVGSLFGWSMMFFIITILEYYKSKDIDWKFLFIIPFYSIIILSHMYMAIISSMIIGCFLLYKLYIHLTKKTKNYLRKKLFFKRLKEYVIAGASIIASFLLTSFWWIDYIRMYDLANRTVPFSYINIKYMYGITPRGILFTFAIPLLFIAIYLLQQKKLNKADKIFFSIPLILSVLMLTRLLSFVPIMNRIGYENMCLFIYLFSLILLFNYRTYIETGQLTKNKKILLQNAIIFFKYTIIIISVIVSTIFAVIYYNSEHIKLPEQDARAMGLVEKHLNVTNKLVIIYNWTEFTYPVNVQVPVHLTLNSYFSFEHNITTPQSVLWQAMDQDIYNNLILLRRSVEEGNCNATIMYMDKIHAQTMLIMDFNCELIYECPEFFKIDQTENMCLLRIK